MNKRYTGMAAFLLVAASAIPSPAQTLTTLVNFNGTNGNTPEYGALVQGSDGNFYGTTYAGGVNGCGTIFKMTPAGALTTIYTFPAPFMCYFGPNAGLVQASDGNFYGTTLNNGTQNYGTIFKITSDGTFATLFNFDYTHGNIPNAGLIQGSDGNLYGTTDSGGTTGLGTVIRVSLSGQVATVHNFGSEQPEFFGPNAGLIQGSDGNFYGTTSGGGQNGSGAIFKITSGGAITLLHSFNIQVDGRAANAPLTLASDGNFYGTTTAGGTGSPFSVYGTVFKITPAGAFTLLHTFTGAGGDGNQPNFAALVQGADGNLYGTTARGGTSNNGTIFKVTPAGAVSTVYSFSVSDGATPLGGMVLGKDGNLYGTTSAGGTGFAGTIFRYSTGGSTTPPPGSGAQVSSVVNDASFKAGGPIASGSWVAVFGTNLAPAGDSGQWNPSTEIVNGVLPTSLDGTSVTVNGKPAAVAYISPTQVNIQAPDDTAVGPVQVVVTTAASGAGTPFTVNYAQFAPGLFQATAPYLAAQHADGSYVGGYAGATPAKPGEVITLWGGGFGPANPPVPAGQVFSGSNQLANQVNVAIGGQLATVQFAGVVGAGLVQINVQVPSSIDNGDAAVVATVGGALTQVSGNMISVHN